MVLSVVRLNGIECDKAKMVLSVVNKVLTQAKTALHESGLKQL